MELEQSIFLIKDKKKIELLGMSFLFYAGSYSIKPILSTIGLGTMESIGALFFYCLWAYKVVDVLVYKRKLDLILLIKVIVTDIAFVMFMYLNSQLFVNTAQYYAEYMMFFRQIVIVFIPCGVVLSQIRCFENVFSYLRRYAIWGSLIMYAALLLGYMSYWDYQYWGIQLSPFIIILVCSYIDTRKKKDILLAIINTALLLLGGRQSVVVVVVAVLFIYIYDNRKKNIKMLFFISIIIIGGSILVSGAYIEFFKVIGSMFESIGIHMEALERIASGNMFSTSTRDIIYKYSFITIARNGSKLSGILADRYYLRNMGQYNSWIQYAHNIYLEFLIDFGLILGSVVSVALTWKVIEAMFLSGSDSRKRLGIMICSLTMIRLLVSSSFIIEGNFFIMIGFIMGMNRKNCQKSRNKKLRV